MRGSRLNDKLRDAQEGKPTQDYAKWDTAYAVMSLVKSGFKLKAAGLSHNQSEGNKDKSVCGIGVENTLRIVCNLWGFLDHKRNSKLVRKPVGDLHLLGVLLTNIRTC
ncbi:unnamed protein product [Discosporangium mesarthrocarpum]